MLKVLLFFTCLAVGEKLLLTQLVHRHGARTPFENLPGLVNKDTQWNCSFAGLEQIDQGPSRTPVGFTGRMYRKVYIEGAQMLPGNCSQGQLTDQGSLMLQELGEFLRGRYVDSGFLPSAFSPEVVRVRSTNVPRTFHSVESLLKTMYPANQPGPGLAEVIAISTIEKGLDYAAPDLAPACPALQERCATIERSSAWAAHSKQAAQLRQELQSTFNSEIPPLFLVMDTLRCLRFHEQPIVVTEEQYDAVQAFSSWELNELYSDPVVTSLGIGVLLQEMMDNIQAAGEPTATSPKMFIYSAHDTTVGLLLGALQLPQLKDWPKFAANLIIELLEEEDTSLSVRVLFNTEVVLKQSLGDFAETAFKAAITKQQRAQQCAASRRFMAPSDPVVTFLC